MSDLTRRVLEADQYIEDDSQDVDWNKFDDARRTLEHSAPTLARQVEAVEALADELDHEASEHMNRPVYSRAGTRIRAALTDAKKGNTP